MALTWSQAKGDAYLAGFREPMLSVMTAIAFAESTLIPDKPNDQGGDALGILQIRPSIWATKVYPAWGHTLTTDEIKDPTKAFKFAHDVILPLQGLGAWDTYNSGAYLTHMADAQSASVDTQGKPDPSTVDPSGGPSNPYDAITGALGSLGGNLASGIGSGIQSAFTNVFLFIAPHLLLIGGAVVTLVFLYKELVTPSPQAA